MLLLTAWMLLGVYHVGVMLITAIRCHTVLNEAQRVTSQLMPHLHPGTRRLNEIGHSASTPWTR